MTHLTDAARMVKIKSIDRPPFWLTLSRNEYDFLIALASRAVEAEAKLGEAMPYFSGAGRFTGMEAVLRGSDDD